MRGFWILIALILACALLLPCSAQSLRDAPGTNPATGPAHAPATDPASARAKDPASAPAADPASVPTASAAFWVFFVDKGPEQPGAAAWLGIAESLPATTWARRSAAGRSRTPDAHDLPLWRPYVEALERWALIRHESRWLNAVSAQLDDAAREQVARLPFVREIRPVARVRRASLGPAFDETGRPLGRTTRLHQSGPAFARTGELAYGSLDYGPSVHQLEEIAVVPVHALGFSGNRVRMMMIDTGFRLDHDAFAATDIVDTWDFVFGDPIVQNEEEDHESQHNHGTGCWGTAGGYAPGHLIGPGYGASFVLSKTEDIRSETRAEEDFYVAALEWADQLGVRVTSASLNYVCFDDEFCYEYEDKDGDTAVITRAIDIAAGRGILCVNSQGNYGCYEGSLGTPADADSMVAVGAVDSLGVIAYFSACGPTYDGRTKPEVLARGVDTYWAAADETGTYGYASGTSLSTPLVGGAAALLFEAHPEWSNMDLRQALLETADRAGQPDNQHGWGRIDAEAALGWTPLTYPLPYSLISPPNGTETENRRPTFTWHTSVDPDAPDPLAYSVRIFEAGDPQSEFLVEAGADTSVTLDFPLAPLTTYRWEVQAEDSAGLTRLSRETWEFMTPQASSVEFDPDAGDLTGAAARMEITSTPNPFRDHVRIRLTVSAAAGATMPAGAMPWGPMPSEPTQWDSMQWRIYDPTGRRVAAGSAPGPATAPVSGHTGVYTAEWDGRLRGGSPAPAGVYYLEARVGAASARQTLLRLDP